MYSFRPTGVSRIGIDVPMIALPSGGPFALAPGTPRVAPFMLMLGPDAPLAKFATIWQGMLNGLVTPLDLTVRIQTPPLVGLLYSDLAWFEIADSYITEFSDGTASPAYIVIQPGVISTVNQTKNSLLYARYIGLPVQASPTFQILGESRMMGVYQNSGGESRVIVDNSGAVTMVPFGDVSVTAVAREPGLQKADLTNFDQLQTWVNAVLGGSGSPYRSVVFTSVPAVGGVAKTVQYADCLPTRINLINPVLVNVNGGLAPYVYDLRLRFAGVQAGPQ